MIFLSKDPLRYKLRWLRYHWRCVLSTLVFGDEDVGRRDAIAIDYTVHMVRYKNARR